MNRKGQGALEYMILIAGAVLVAAIVIAIVTGLTTGGEEASEQREIDALCAGIPGNRCGVESIAPIDPDALSTKLGTANCLWDVALDRCRGTTSVIELEAECVKYTDQTKCNEDHACSWNTPGAPATCTKTKCEIYTDQAACDADTGCKWNTGISKCIKK